MADGHVDLPKGYDSRITSDTRVPLNIPDNKKNDHDYLEKAVGQYLDARYGPEKPTVTPPVNMHKDSASFTGRFSQVMPEDNDKGVVQGLKRGLISPIIDAYKTVTDSDYRHQKQEQKKLPIIDPNGDLNEHGRQVAQGIPVLSDASRLAAGDIAGEAAQYTPSILGASIAALPKVRAVGSGFVKGVTENPPQMSRFSPAAMLGAGINALKGQSPYAGAAEAGALEAGVEGAIQGTKGAIREVKNIPSNGPSYLGRGQVQPRVINPEFADSVPVEMTKSPYQHIDMKALPAGPARVFKQGDPQATYYPGDTGPQPSQPITAPPLGLPSPINPIIPPEPNTGFEHWNTQATRGQAPIVYPPKGLPAPETGPAHQMPPAGTYKPPVENADLAKSEGQLVNIPKSVTPIVNKPDSTVKTESIIAKPEVKPIDPPLKPTIPKKAQGEDDIIRAKPKVEAKQVNSEDRLKELMYKKNLSEAEESELDNLANEKEKKNATQETKKVEVKPPQSITSKQQPERTGKEEVKTSQPDAKSLKAPEDDPVKLETERRAKVDDILKKAKSGELTLEDKQVLKSNLPDKDIVSSAEIGSLARSHDVEFGVMGNKLHEMGVKIEPSKTVGKWGLGQGTKGLEGTKAKTVGKINSINEEELLSQLKALGKSPEKVTPTEERSSSKAEQSALDKVKAKYRVEKPKN